MRIPSLLPLVLWTSLATPSLALPVSDPRTTVIAISGDPAPGGGTYHSFFIEPVMNNQGHVAFVSMLRDIGAGSPYGMFRWDGVTTVAIGGPASNPPVTFATGPALNEAGEVAFIGSRFAAETSVLRGTGGAATEIVREGQTVPGGGTVAYVFEPMLNDMGQVAVALSFDPSGETGGFYRGSGSALTEIARLHRPAPTGGNYAAFKHAYPINNAGQVAFAATTTLPDSGAILLGDGVTTTKIVQHGDLAPDGDGTFGNMGGQTPALNDRGEVAFFGRVHSSEMSFLYDGVYLHTAGSLTQLVRGGQPTPNRDANFYTFSYGPVLNDKSQAAFVAFLLKPEKPLEALAAVYRAEETGLTEVMREGALAPGGNGSFSDFGNPEINNRGNIAVMAQLMDTNGGNSDDQGLYFYSNRGRLVEVAREGQPLLGSSIQSLIFTGALNHVPTTGDELTGLNDLGQVAYVFHLADGRSGVAVWQIPEPSSIAMIVLLLVHQIVGCRQPTCNVAGIN